MTPAWPSGVAAFAVRPGAALPEGDVSRDDIEHLHFSLAFRGYRMDGVDATLDRLADELADRDARIVELEAERDPSAERHDG